MTIGVVVLTLNSEKNIRSCLAPFINSPLNPKLLVVDSSSVDGTVSIVKQLGVEVIQIEQSKFNHGKTREFARKYIERDIIVFLTPDAHAIDSTTLEKLISPLQQGKASVAYARQIPHEGASFFESFPRNFNYPSISEIRCIADTRRYGPFAFFCSDSCAAYKNSALDEIQGFKEVLLGEDTLAVAELLKKGHKIAYVAEAVVRHSHNYSILEEFFRYFDTGLMRKVHQNILDCGEGDMARGTEYMKQMLSYLRKNKPHLIPYACCHILAKWLGYRLGQASVKSPVWWKKALSSQKYYWEKNATS